LTRVGVASPYYLLHTVHNVGVVALTWPDVVHTFTDFHALETYTINTSAVALVVALHLYHILMYRASLRFDDWLHHALMIGVAIPVGLVASGQTPLMGVSLFFATGLPGAVSYASLFFQRNGCLGRLTEKGVNTAMNVWIRAPGCAGHAALTAAWALSAGGVGAPTVWERGLALLPAALMYWNGQYFMQQAVADYARRRLEEMRHEV
jgi:hypothetical protein